MLINNCLIYLGTLIWMFIYLWLYYLLDVLISLSLYNSILCLLLPFLAWSLFHLKCFLSFPLRWNIFFPLNLNLCLPIWMKSMPCRQHSWVLFFLFIQPDCASWLVNLIHGRRRLGMLQSMESQSVGHDLTTGQQTTATSTFYCLVVIMRLTW